jgi:hypothetical protein
MSLDLNSNRKTVTLFYIASDFNTLININHFKAFNYEVQNDSQKFTTYIVLWVFWTFIFI